MNERQLTRRLRAQSEPRAPKELRARLEEAIPASFGRPHAVRIVQGVWSMGKWGAIIGGPAALVLWLVSAIVVSSSAPVTFASALKPVVRGTGEVAAVHFVLHRLTREGEDFSFVDLDGPGLTLDVWVEAPAAEPGRSRFRMEKADRVVVFDGMETVLYLTQKNEAYRHEGPSSVAAAYWPANWVRELREQPAQGVEQLLYQESDGEARLVVREKGVDTGPLPKAFLGDYDRETELRWSLDTHALTGLRTWVDVDGELRLYSDLLAIDYLPEVHPERFRVELPADARIGGVKEGSAAHSELGPKDVARGLFEAALRNDRAFLELHCPSPAFIDWALDQPPFEILYIGEPFRSGSYAGVYVPYKIRIGGRVKQWQLALRNDNPQRRWVFDGGI